MVGNPTPKPTPKAILLSRLRLFNPDDEVPEVGLAVGLAEAGDGDRRKLVPEF